MCSEVEDVGESGSILQRCFEVGSGLHFTVIVKLAEGVEQGNPCSIRQNKW